MDDELDSDRELEPDVDAAEPGPDLSNGPPSPASSRPLNGIGEKGEQTLRSAQHDPGADVRPQDLRTSEAAESPTAEDSLGKQNPAGLFQLPDYPITQLLYLGPGPRAPASSRLSHEGSNVDSQRSGEPHPTVAQVHSLKSPYVQTIPMAHAWDGITLAPSGVAGTELPNLATVIANDLRRPVRD